VAEEIPRLPLGRNGHERAVRHARHESEFSLSRTNIAVTNIPPAISRLDIVGGIVFGSKSHR
jgi:hypothetical protein